MALLRQCLQALRTKNGELDGLAHVTAPAAWPQAGRGTGARHAVPAQRWGDAPAAAMRRLPAA